MDNTRKMLKTIRTLQEQTKKNLFNREFGLLKEEEEDLTDQPPLSDDEVEQGPEQAFKDEVSSMVEFNEFKQYEDNVEWSGKLIREGISWVYSLDDTVGCYIETDGLLQLRDETVSTIKKLRAYYDVWSTEWTEKISG